MLPRRPSHSSAGATTINTGASLVMRGGFNYTTAEPVTLGGTGSAGGIIDVKSRPNKRP